MTAASRPHSGFTLVEVLVGTAVLGILVSLLSSALFTVARSARGGEIRLDTLDADRLIRAFIRRELRQAVPLTLRENVTEKVVFDGHGDRLRFVGHLPAHRGGGGLQLIELRTERAETSNALVLSFRSAWPGVTVTAPPSARWSRHVLLSAVTSAEFTFYGRRNDDGPFRWHARWTESNRLPALVRLEIELEDRRWAPLVVDIATRTARGQPQLYREASEGAP